MTPLVWGYFTGLLLVEDQRRVGWATAAFTVDHCSQSFAVAGKRKLLGACVDSLCSVLTGKGSLAHQVKRAARYRGFRRKLAGVLSKVNIAGRFLAIEIVNLRPGWTAATTAAHRSVAATHVGRRLSSFNL